MFFLPENLRHRGRSGLPVGEVSTIYELRLAKKFASNLSDVVDGSSLELCLELPHYALRFR